MLLFYCKFKISLCNINTLIHATELYGKPEEIITAHST